MLGRALIVGTLALLAGCEYGPSHLDREDAAHAQSRAGVPVYWLGESFAGLPLTAAESEGPGRALFVYGECEGESEGIDDFHCTSPQLHVQQLPFSAVAWRIASGCRTLRSLRGVPLLYHGGLVLVTRRGIVKVFGRDPAESRRMATALRPVEGDARAELPAPTAAQR